MRKFIPAIDVGDGLQLGPAVHHPLDILLLCHVGHLSSRGTSLGIAKASRSLACIVRTRGLVSKPQDMQVGQSSQATIHQFVIREILASILRNPGDPDAQSLP